MRRDLFAGYCVSNTPGRTGKRLPPPARERSALAPETRGGTNEETTIAAPRLAQISQIQLGAQIGLAGLGCKVKEGGGASQGGAIRYHIDIVGAHQG